MKYIKPKYLIATGFLLVFLVCFMGFYVSRVNIYEPLILKAKMDGKYVDSGIVVKGVQPLGGLHYFQDLPHKYCWETKEGYYQKIIVEITAIQKSTSGRFIILEVYKAVDQKLIAQYTIVPSNRNLLEIDKVQSKEIIPLLKKIIGPFTNGLVSILVLIFASLFILLIKKEHLLKAVNKFIVAFIIIWGYGWLILAAQFTFPNAEDLSLVLHSRNSGVFNAAIQLLLTFDGRYFTNLMHGLNPLMWWGVNFYKWQAVFSLLLITLSFYYFIITLFAGKIKKNSALIAACFAIVFHFYIIPSIIEEFYWMAGNFVYLYAWILFFLWTAMLMRVITANNSRAKMIYFFIAAILMICSYGTNEMMLILNTATLLGFGVYVFKNSRQNKEVIVLFCLIACACIYLFVSAPGIYYRYNSFGIEKDITFYKNSLFEGALQFSTTILKWLFYYGISIPIIITVSLFLTKINLKNTWLEFSKKNLLIFSLILFLLMGIMPFTYYFTMGYQMFPARIYNFINWCFMLEFFLILPVILIRYNIFSGMFFQRWQTQIYTVLLIFMVFQLIFSKNNISDIQKEYGNGNFAKYQKEMTDRYTILENSKYTSGWKCAIIDSLTAWPVTISSKPDIQNNRKDVYWNHAYEGFFMLDEVRLRSDTITKEKLIRDEAGL